MDAWEGDLNAPHVVSPSQIAKNGLLTDLLKHMIEISFLSQQQQNLL